MDGESAPLYEKVIYEDEIKCFQLRLVLNEFREKVYLHIRKYFLSFEGEYIPSREGVTMELTMSNSFALMDGLLEIMSDIEGESAIEKYFGEKLGTQRPAA